MSRGARDFLASVFATGIAIAIALLLAHWAACEAAMC